MFFLVDGRTDGRTEDRLGQQEGVFFKREIDPAHLPFAYSLLLSYLITYSAGPFRCSDCARRARTALPAAYPSRGSNPVFGTLHSHPVACSSSRGPEPCSNPKD